MWGWRSVLSFSAERSYALSKQLKGLLRECQEANAEPAGEVPEKVLWLLSEDQLDLAQALDLLDSLQVPTEASSEAQLVPLVLALCKAAVTFLQVLHRAHLHTTRDVSHSLHYWRGQEQNPWLAALSVLPAKIWRSAETMNWTWLAAGPAKTVEDHQYSVAEHKAALKRLRRVHATYVGLLSHTLLFDIVPASGGQGQQETFEQMRVTLHDHLVMIDSILESVLQGPATMTPLPPIGVSPASSSQRTNEPPRPVAEVLASVADSHKRLCAAGASIKNHIRQSKASLAAHRPPSIIVQKWIPALAFLTGSYLIGRSISKRRHSIRQLGEDLRVVGSRLVEEWVVKPIIGIYDTIRYTDLNLVTSANALEIDSQSLERMIDDFVRIYGAQLGDLPAATPVEMVMRSYEKDVQAPIHSILFGSMMQNILIQVQRQKVDVERTMAAVDRLLRSNQLNFQVLTALPVLAMSWLLGGRAVSLLTTRLGIYSYALRASVRSHMRVLERLLMQRDPEEDDRVRWIREGLIMMTLDNMRQWAMSLSRDDMRKFTEDVRDLETVPVGDSQQRVRLDIVLRMYRTHLFLQ